MSVSADAAVATASVDDKNNNNSNNNISTSTTTVAAVTTAKKGRLRLKHAGAEAHINNTDNNSDTLLNFPLFLPMPVTGMTLWDQILAGAVSHREYAINAACDESKTNGKLVQQLGRVFEERKKRQELAEQARGAALSKIGKQMARAVDKCWSRARRGFEAKCALETEIMKQQKAEKRQASFLKDTEKLTAFLADSFRSLAAGGAGGNGTTTDDTTTRKKKNSRKNNNTNKGDVDQQQQLPAFEHDLKLLNTLNGQRPLRPYQRSALAFLINLYKNNLNAILADEMGLGKTVQTLALFAYFAEFKQDWGPHLVVVPASILSNWELECMRWVPGFKVIKYHGSAKERERLRRGWTAEGAFHICLASYATVVQDRNMFKRRLWGFLVLDEAHQIKNWQSQKWQVLFELQSSYRLLLSGTPLQTSVMELWSLLRFIVPPQVAIHAAQLHLQQAHDGDGDGDGNDDEKTTTGNNNNNNDNSHRQQLSAAFESMEDFQRWFSDPLTAMVTGQSSFDSSVVTRLHTLLRPFFFRRLKCDVETQLPPKTEVVVLCPLSKRQKQLYEDFLGLAETKATLACGSYLGVVRVLLSLRKTCNHPDLFAERPVMSPLVLDPQLDRIVMRVPRAVFLDDISSSRSCSCSTSSSFRRSVAVTTKSSSSSSDNGAGGGGGGCRVLVANINSSSSSGAFRLAASCSEVWHLTDRAAEYSCSRPWVLHIDDLSMMTTENNNNNNNNQNQNQQSAAVEQDAAVTSAKKKKGSSAAQHKKDTKKQQSVNNNSHTRFVKTPKTTLEESITKFITRASKTRTDDAVEYFLREQFLSSTNPDAADDDIRSAILQAASTTTDDDDSSANSRVSRVVRFNSERNKSLLRSKPFVVPRWCCHVPTTERLVGSPELLSRKYFIFSASERIAACADLLRHFVVVVPKVWTRSPLLVCALPLRLVASCSTMCASPATSGGHLHLAMPTAASPRGGGGGGASGGCWSVPPTPLQVADPYDVAYEVCRCIREECVAAAQAAEKIHTRGGIVVAQGRSNKKKSGDGEQEEGREEERRETPATQQENTSTINISDQQRHIPPPPPRMITPNFNTRTPADKFESGWDLSHYFHFPETRWVVQDCGKFFVLLPLFKKLSAEGHRVLIFTQFTQMLGILEKFLAFMGLAYLRLDGSIPPDERQFRVEQFNRDARIFAMVLSTRSGGIGLNLVGADTVVFFDSDWNPAMDLQAQDRCHRIGQTRAVTIYRLVSEHTVEANIVKKARQRKVLNNLVIRSGQFHRQLGDFATGGDDSSSGSSSNADKQQAAAASLAQQANSLNREALLNFFHDRDEDDATVVVRTTTATAAAATNRQAGNDDDADGGGGDGEGKENNNNDNNNNETMSPEEQEWAKATAAVEDAEDRAAGTAAAAEQSNAERTDWLDGLDEEVLWSPPSATDHARLSNNQQQQQLLLHVHCVRRNFSTGGGVLSDVGSSSSTSSSSVLFWPPALHSDAGINQRLVTATRNATNSAVEAWAAMAVPFFDRSAAELIRAKVAEAKKVVAATSMI